MGDNLICGNSEGCPVSHVVQFDAHLPLSPVRTDLFIPKLCVAGAETEDSTSVVVTFNIPVAVSYTCCRVHGSDLANRQLQ